MEFNNKVTYDEQVDEIIGLALLYGLIDIDFEISDSENKDKRSLAKIFHDSQIFNRKINRENVLF